MLRRGGIIYGSNLFVVIKGKEHNFGLGVSCRGHHMGKRLGVPRRSVGVWQEIGNRNIGANILDNIVKRNLKRWLVCCFTCLLM